MPITIPIFSIGQDHVTFQGKKYCKFLCLFIIYLFECDYVTGNCQITLHNSLMNNNKIGFASRSNNKIKLIFIHLQVNIDQTFSWKNHIAHAKSRLFSRIDLLRRIPFYLESEFLRYIFLVLYHFVFNGCFLSLCL